MAGPGPGPGSVLLTVAASPDGGGWAVGYFVKGHQIRALAMKPPAEGS